MKAKINRVVFTALFAALVCVATLSVRVPTVAGYTNLGDALVLLSAFFSGPLCGFLAGGVGSAAADLISGYAHYVPGTFIIKGLSALFAALLLKRALKKTGGAPKTPALALSAIPAELFMAAGYFAYKSLILGRPEAALTSIPGNLVQGLLGTVLSVLLYRLLTAIPDIREKVWKG